MNAHFNTWDDYVARHYAERMFAILGEAESMVLDLFPSIENAIRQAGMAGHTANQLLQGTWLDSNPCIEIQSFKGRFKHAKLF